MDNDLMARRLRPPSEPMQPATQPFEPMTPAEPVPPWDPIQPTQQGAAPVQSAEHLPAWPPAPVIAEPPSMPVTAEWPPAPPDPQPAAEPADDPTAPWAPESRQEVPWDRPDDYEQPTDTAAAEEKAPWDRPPDEAWAVPNPEWPPVTHAVVTQQVADEQAAEPADPYDALAPVVGDVAQTMSLAWPEANGHHADLNGSAMNQTSDAVGPPVESAPSTLPVGDAPRASWPEASWPIVAAPAASEPEWVAPNADWMAEPPATATAPEAEWYAPEPELEPAPSQPEAFAPETSVAPEPAPAPVAPEPALVPPEWVMPAQPAGYAEHQIGPTPPDDLFFTAVPTDVAQPEQELDIAAAAEHSDADAWLNETSEWALEEPAPDLPPAPEFPPAPDVPMAAALTEAVESAFESTDTGDSADVFVEDETPPEAVEAAEPEAAAPEVAEVTAAGPEAAPTSVVLRIELAIVDGQLQVVNSAADPRNVTPDVGEPVDVTPRTADFDPRSHQGQVDEEQATALPLAPLATATDQVPWADEVDPAAIPAATPDVPWADPVSQAAPGSYTPWAQSSPAMDPLTAIPAGQVVAAPAQQQYTPQDFTSQAVIAPSIFAPPVQPYAQPYAQEPAAPAPFVDMTPAAAPSVAPAAASAAAQNQDDLWFLSTEPEDVDAVATDEASVAPKESSSVLTAALTIGMAILVIVLVLVFFSLMTSLLG